jgi:hypothetical protein
MGPEGFAALESWIHERGIEQIHACLEATGEYGAALALAILARLGERLYAEHIERALAQLDQSP